MKILKTKTLTLLMLLSVALISISSCKKDSETSSDAQSKVRGKWTIVSNTMAMTLPGAPKETATIDGIAGDYIEFAADGTVTIVLLGQKATATYKVESASKITFSGQSGTITTLTDKAFSFTSKISSNGSILEQTYVLKK